MAKQRVAALSRPSNLNGADYSALNFEMNPYDFDDNDDPYCENLRIREGVTFY